MKKAIIIGVIVLLVINGFLGCGGSGSAGGSVSTKDATEAVGITIAAVMMNAMMAAFARRLKA